MAAVSDVSEVVEVIETGGVEAIELRGFLEVIEQRGSSN